MVGSDRPKFARARSVLLMIRLPGPLVKSNQDFNAVATNQTPRIASTPSRTRMDVAAFRRLADDPVNNR